MTLFRRHPDAATLGLAILGGADPRVSAHLVSCPKCRQERGRIAALLGAARDGLETAIDAEFGPVELERQRQAILHRIAKSAGRARLLRFPNGSDRPQPAPRANARWLVAAAAAGLLIGGAAGQLPYLFTAARDAAPSLAPVAAMPVVNLRTDDPLLSEVEAALDQDTRGEFDALDALTPIHYETR